MNVFSIQRDGLQRYNGDYRFKIEKMDNNYEGDQKLLTVKGMTMVEFLGKMGGGYLKDCTGRAELPSVRGPACNNGGAFDCNSCSWSAFDQFEFRQAGGEKDYLFTISDGMVRLTNKQWEQKLSEVK